MIGTPLSPTRLGALSARDFLLGSGEPRIEDLRLADRLGFDKPHNIRKLIIRNRDELAGYGDLVDSRSPVARGLYRPSGANFLHGGENPRGGRPGTTFYLNEGQSLVICALSRTAVSPLVRRELIGVYIAFRRGMLPGGYEAGLSMLEPVADRERLALQDIVDLGHVFEDGGHHYMVFPLSRSLAMTLASFEADDQHGGNVEDQGEDANEDGGDIQSEPHDEEPDREDSLGAPEEHPGIAGWYIRDRSGDQTEWGSGLANDCELTNEDGNDEEREGGDDVDREDGGDTEPSLGSVDHANQVLWSASGTEDREGPDDDREPSLGSGNIHPGIIGVLRPDGTMDRSAATLGWDQSLWAEGSGDDREEDAGNAPERENEHGDDRGLQHPLLANSPAEREAARAKVQEAKARLREIVGGRRP